MSKSGKGLGVRKGGTPGVIESVFPPEIPTPRSAYERPAWVAAAEIVHKVVIYYVYTYMYIYMWTSILLNPST
jgi:hypothetical protein